MMLVQETESTFIEIGTVSVVTFESEDSWDVLALLLSYFIVFFFELVEFISGLLFKLLKEIRIDVNEFAVFNSANR